MVAGRLAILRGLQIVEHLHDARLRQPRPVDRLRRPAPQLAKQHLARRQLIIWRPARAGRLSYIGKCCDPHVKTDAGRRTGGENCALFVYAEVLFSYAALR